MLKTERELLYFELFIDSRPEFRGGSTSQPAPPAPDIVYALGTKVIGVELTELHAREGIRKEEGEQSAVLSRAKEIYESVGHALVSVSVVWADGFRGDKRLREERATGISQLIAAHIPPAGKYLGLGSEPVGELFTHPLFDAMWIERIVPYEPGENIWTSEYHWWAATADEGFVQKHLDRKQGKRGSYPAQCTEAWLLLTVRGTKPSSGFTLTDSALRAEYRSDYDRAFILETLRGASHELRLSAT